MVGRCVGMEPGNAVIRWWVVNPVNTDNYEVFIVQDGPDQYKGYYYHDEGWHLYHYAEIIRPAIVLPGLLAMQMEASGREDQSIIRDRIQNLCEEVWESITKGKEPV